MQDDNANDQKVEMWTDGACKGNPGPGGWGVLMRAGAHEKTMHGGEAQTTNNRMELLAVIEGLRALKRPCVVTIHTDSQYVMKGMTEWPVSYTHLMAEKSLMPLAASVLIGPAEMPLARMPRGPSAVAR